MVIFIYQKKDTGFLPNVTTLKEAIVVKVAVDTALMDITIRLTRDSF